MALPATDEIGRGLRAAWGLLTEGARNPIRFDMSLRGCCVSFTALGLSLPAFVCLLAANAARPDAPLSHSLALEPEIVLASTLQHLAPFMLAPLFVLLLLRQTAPLRFAPFLVAWNWAEVLVSGFAAIPAAMLALGLIPPELALPYVLAYVALATRLRYALMRSTLAAPPAYAALLVGAVFLLEVSMAGLAGSIII